MVDLDRFFEKPQVPSHPKVRFWRTLLEKGQVASLRVEIWREAIPLSVNPPRLFVHFYDAQGQEILDPEEMDWDDKVNDELLKLDARAITDEHEARRFSLVLRSRFEIVASRFGDGFFNAVLMQYLRSSGLGKLPKVRQLIDEIHCYNPSGGTQQEACAEMIEEVFGACFDFLYDDGRKYPKERTISIMGEAVAAYLDERFSVSDRRAMGFV